MGDAMHRPACAALIGALALVAVVLVIRDQDTSMKEEAALDELFKGAHSQGLKESQWDEAREELDQVYGAASTNANADECVVEKHDGYSVTGHGKACCLKRFTETA